MSTLPQSAEKSNPIPSPYEVYAREVAAAALVADALCNPEVIDLLKEEFPSDNERWDTSDWCRVIALDLTRQMKGIEHVFRSRTKEPVAQAAAREAKALRHRVHGFVDAARRAKRRSSRVSRKAA